MLKTVRWLVVAAIVVVLGGVALFSHFFTDMWWFQQLGYLRTFWARIAWVWGVRLGAGLLAAVFIYLNLRITRHSAAQAMFRLQDRLPASLSWRTVRWGYALVSLVLGVLYGTTASANWQAIAMFLNKHAFNLADPIFHQDVGFYVFSLPFYNLIYSLVMGLLVLSLLCAGAIYLFTGSMQLEGFRLQLTGAARWHLSLLLAAILGLKAWGYLLNLYKLLYSSVGVVYGVSYTNMVANRPVLYIMAGLAAVIALLIFINAFRAGAARWIVAGLVTLGAASVVLGSIYPGLVQKLRVEPNQLKLEQPYITHHIAMTRAAYNLDNIVEKDFDANTELTRAELNENKGTINNVRLWDWQSLLKASRQLQEFKSYYQFQDMDVDRYNVNGVYTQVMLAARELEGRGLPTPNWINQHLVYTHGYGVVASPVNRVTSEGLPDFLLANIPPTGAADLQVTRPEIYFGEMSDQSTPYVIVNTRQNEFDYPQGDNDVYTKYAGSGGVPIGNPLRRLAFAARFGAPTLLLNADITAESRVMMYRNIRTRVDLLAPFLKYDNDPYLVIDAGRLYWILDAYTTSDRFPYSRPWRVAGWGASINYVRNSVKVVADAYNGDVVFYLMEEEPVARTLFAVYGVPFRPVAEMPAGLRQHLRYPEGLFEIQSNLYATYHMTDNQVFYNKSDAWEVPAATGNSNDDVVNTGVMEPYYVIMHLPGEPREELVLLRPYTPQNKNNMAAWLAARCDGANYGKLILYKFSKQSLVYGPAQIEARIDQDGDISQLLTLWGQSGSEVIRGNLLVIPVGNSLLYVEPLFLQAEKSQMPELKRVIAVHGGNVALGLNLTDALNQLVSGKAAAAAPAATAASPKTSAVSGAEKQRLTELSNKAQQALDELRRAISALGGS